VRKEAQSSLSCGRAYYQKSSYNKCFEAANDAQAVLREAGDRWGQAQALHMAAKVHSIKKEHEQSLRLAERAARLFKETGDGTSEVRALLTACTEGVLVCAAGHRGAVASKNFNDQMEKSLRQSQGARDVALKIGEERLYAVALRICAQVTMYNGKPVEASKLAEEAANIARSMKDDKGEGTSLIIMAEACFNTRKFTKAMQACENSLPLFRKAGDASGEQTALYLMGQIDAESAEFDMVKRDGSAPKAADEAAPVAEDSKAETAVAMPDKEKFLATLPLPQRVSYQIKDLIGAITGRGAEIDNDQTVMEAGLTSISAIMLRDQLNDQFPDAEGMEMTFVFEYPTVQAMTDFILEAMEEGEG
jgi:tetratricopeptide (TPR) repeat protein